MTERLYLENSYLKEFKAQIIEKAPNGVVLDKTVFYPESGGQVGDKGTLEIENRVINVTNTRLDKGKIIHEIPDTEMELGVEVKGKINWDFRFRLMRSHSAQHVISRWFQLNLEAETVSTQLKYEKSRLDLHPLRKISSDELETIEKSMNEYLFQNLPISITSRPRKEAIEFLKEKKYQIKYLEMVPKSVQDFRIITIGEYDFAACAGTHVENTSEIGEIKLWSTKNKGKLRERIFYSVYP
ncbi:MAG: alanyl-tRNA editing protein [Candidatus Hodarchaeales archaeon]|jgi:misacylated tRNA(Ala) deacylase